ncbi:MAG: cysteine synthase B [Gammaproteobacteria bacterium]|nr:MAG: cysteine synthase B [Gammaproteobacteria bacterium]
MSYKNITDYIGNTPIVALQKMNPTSNNILLKLEGNNPAGSVKDRPAFNMIYQAQKRGDIDKNTTLIEATSGNTGIAIAMVSAILGYKIILIMPDDMSDERKDSMSAYGAELILVDNMETARDLALEMQQQNKGYVLDQFSNPDNPQAHYKTTAPEIIQQTNGKITHFVSSMGTTGTITGCGRYFKDKKLGIKVIGATPAKDSQIPGIRKWEKEYLPKFFDPSLVDESVDVNQEQAEQTMKNLATEEGIFCGVSAGGAVWVALQVAKKLQNKTIVVIIPDRGDRYLSTGVFR